MAERFLGKYDHKKQKWLHEAIEIFLIFFVVFVVFKVIIGVSFVKGTSMFPTLHNNEIVLYTRIGSNYDRGDIVSVKMPSGDYYVKRVVAVAGDEVDIRGGRLYINGKESEESYTAGETTQKDGNVTYPYVVEEGKFFVMGDNREHSMDSRAFGAVVKSQIKGEIRLYFGKV